MSTLTLIESIKSSESLYSNKVKNNVHLKSTREFWIKHVYYNKFTGKFYWKNDYVTRGSSHIAGESLGHMQRGYRYLSFKGNIIRASRLAFLFMEGYIPSNVDHDNHDTDNNKWSNLNASNPSHNSKNRILSSSNTSGTTGVTWKKRNKKWCAQIKIHGKVIYLGLFSDIKDAITRRKEEEIAYEFNVNHGKKLCDIK